LPKIITLEQEIAYLRALADTGNATLAAERSGVSRTWAYKRREVDARFDALCREMIDRFRTPEPPHPARAAGESPSPAYGRGTGKRVRVNRGRKGGWTAAKEARFLAALAATRDVPLAALQVRISTVSAYRHRMVRPDFAARWRAALADDETFADAEWIGTLICMLEGEPVPADYPVQSIGIGDVIRLYERELSVRHGRPMRP
jgi:hypothetical protein